MSTIWGHHPSFDGALYYDGISMNIFLVRYPSDYFPEGLPENIRSVVVDEKNVVWFSADGLDPQEFGQLIYKYDNNYLSFINCPRVYSGRKSFLTINSYNRIWLFESMILKVAGYGFAYYDGISFIKIPLTIERDIAVNNIYTDSNNIIWIASESGLYYYDSVNLSNYNAQNSEISSNFVLSVAEDRNSVKWIGTDSGVSRFDGETWTTFNTYNSGLCNDKVNAITVENNNTIWFGTDNGVSEYTGEIIPVSVEEETTPEPVPVIRFYPNPFNPTTTIEFTLPDAGLATLTIYNMAGQKIRELAAERMTAGTHRFQWDGKNDSGSPVSAGIYIARLKAGEMTATGKLVLVK